MTYICRVYSLAPICKIKLIIEGRKEGRGGQLPRMDIAKAEICSNMCHEQYG
jgi:hypothetical protein